MCVCSGGGGSVRSYVTTTTSALLHPSLPSHLRHISHRVVASSRDGGRLGGRGRPGGRDRLASRTTPVWKKNKNRHRNKKFRTLRLGTLTTPSHARTLTTPSNGHDPFARSRPLRMVTTPLHAHDPFGDRYEGGRKEGGRKENKRKMNN